LLWRAPVARIRLHKGHGKGAARKEHTVVKRPTWLKRPKWLGDSRATKSDKLKKARQQTDQRMRHQDAQNKQRDESEKKK
jgi:hypothetical protein